MTPTMKRVLLAVVLVLALIGAAFLGATVYRVGRMVYLLDEIDLQFLHQARMNVEAQQAAQQAAPRQAPKPPEAPAP